MNVISASGSGYPEGRKESPRIARTESVEAEDGMTLLIRQYVAAEKDWESAKRAHMQAYERYLNCWEKMIRAGFVLNVEPR